MELFTLGADRGAYTETDVREQARALTGWTGNVVQRRDRELHLRRQPPRHRDRRRSSARPATSPGRTRVNLCLDHPLHPSFFVEQAVGLLHPDAARHGDRRRRSQALYTKNGFKVHPVVEAILLHPDFYYGPRMVKPPVVLNAGLLRMRGRYIDTSAWWTLSAAGGPAALLPARRRRLGRHALARHGDLARPLVHRRARAGRRRRRPTARAIPPKLVDPRARLLGQPDDLAETQSLLAAFAKAQLKRKVDAGRRRDGAAPARRLLSRPPDRMTIACHDCSAYRGPPPRGGRGRPRAARDRAGNAAPGRHGPHAPRLRLAHGRARARGLRRQRALGARVRRRDRAPRRRRPRPRTCSSSIFLIGGIDALSVLFPAGDPAYYSLRPNIAIAQTPGRAFTEDDRLRWHPTAGGLSTLHAEGKVSVHPGDRLRQQRQVALHLAPLLGGRRDRRDAPHRLARPVPRPRGRGRTTRSRGSRSTRRSSRRSRRRRCPWRRSRPPTSTRSRRPGFRRTRSRRRCSRRRRTSAPRTRSPRMPGSRQAGAIALESHHLYYRARQRSSTGSTARSPTRRRPTRSRTGSPGSRR